MGDPNVRCDCPPTCGVCDERGHCPDHCRPRRLIGWRVRWTTVNGVDVRGRTVDLVSAWIMARRLRDGQPTVSNVRVMRVFRRRVK